MDLINTHKNISQKFCGVPTRIKAGYCQVELQTIPEMVADEEGLIHGGFVFSAADYAAMLAVNHPFVVLGSAEIKFLKPVRLGEKLIIEAAVTEEKGKKRIVQVSAKINENEVIMGMLTCFVLEKHVLNDAR